MDTKIRRIDNILYGAEVDISLNNMGLGRTVFEKMRKYSEKLLQIDPDTNEQETYQEVNIKCVRFALTLKNYGIDAGDIILICSENSMESLFLTYGTLYLNAIAVTLDPHIPLIDAVHLLNVVSPKMIVVIENSLELIEKSLAQLDIATRIVVIGTHMRYQTLNGFLGPQPSEQTFVPKCVENLQSPAMIFFSSGTTGLPKAVCYSHEAILKSCIGLSLDIIDYTTCLHYTSPHHAAAFLFSTAEILLGGKRIIGRTFTPERFLRYVEHYKVTFSVLIPSYATQFNEETARNYKTDGLTEMRICGRIAASEQMKALFTCFPETKIYTLYGQTEAGVISMFSKSSECLSGTKFDSCGVPFINTMIKIVDMETGCALGPYEKGEIRLINGTAFSGYYKETEHQNSLDTDGFLKTGDIGYYDEDNCLYFSGRLLECFKYRNWCIVPTCIEAAIYKHPAVLEAIVIGMPHAVDQHHPFALVVLKEDSDVSEAELLAFANARVSEREKLRAGVKIVKELPKTCTGKIPRQVVKQMLLTGNFNRYFM